MTGSAAADRKISFAVLGAIERSDSLHSSTTSISQADAPPADAKGRYLRVPRYFLQDTTRYDTIRYDTRCCFNVRSKADMSQLNPQHGTDN